MTRSLGRRTLDASPGARRIAMPFADLDVPIYYERTGTGPPMLFVHGMCGDAEVFADQARRFADRCTCVRYDRRGHTRSARGDRPISDALHADDAAALIESLDLDPCLVVASSGGAAIAVDLVRRHGRLVHGLVASEPPLFSLDPEAGAALKRELVPRIEAALEAGGPRSAVDAFFSFVCPGLWDELDEARKDRYRDNADIGLADLRAPSLEITDVTDASLREVTTPTLVLSGERSAPAFRSIARRLASALTDARLVELPGSGHVTYAERPDEFAGAVSDFVTSLSRSSPAR
jgi:pimeloyl-ACP methyl ester carboxylesterase